MTNPTTKQIANAIYDLAKQSQLTDQIISDLKQVEEKLSESPSFLMHLSDRNVKLKQKEEDLIKVFSDFISQKTYKIILMLVKVNKIKKIKQVITDIEKLKKIDDEVIDAKIYVYYPLDETRKAKIKSILQTKTSKQIIIHEIIDKKITGGIKIDLSGYGLKKSRKIQMNILFFCTFN